jgi:dihydroorotate dehydrogenase electron transfer subunit
MAAEGQETEEAPMSLLHAKFNADTATQRVVAISETEQLAEQTFRLRLDCPEIARRITPGQFLMVRPPRGDDPLLGRPLALYDTVVDERGVAYAIDVVYLVVGKMTRLLSQLRPGAALSVWGPLGNGFLPLTTEHLIMVAGGIGQTPFMALAREYLGLRQFGQPPRSIPAAGRVTLCYGARSAKYLAGVDEFRELGVEVRLATDDGSAGHHGLVTDLLERELSTAVNGCRIVCCGPEPMMEAVGRIAKSVGTPCEVSLETPMACGIGICFSCVAKVRDSRGDWDYKRTCVEGPVFPAESIVW